MYFSNITPGVYPTIKALCYHKVLTANNQIYPPVPQKAKMRNIQNIIKTLSNPVDISGSQVHANFYPHQTLQWAFCPFFLY